MTRQKREIPRHLTEREILNPTPDLSADAIAYGRQSNAKQVVEHLESHKAQTIELLRHMHGLGYRDDGTTGKVTLRIENQIADDGRIRNASGAWPIDRRPHLKVTLDEIEADQVKLIAVDEISRLFRDEDQIDSNIFLKACKEHGCYIYVVALKMVFNLANDNHMMMVRLLLQQAASYLKTLKDTVLRRRSMARNSGQYAGCGPLKMGYVRDSDKTSKTYGKQVLYPPHAEQGKWLYKRIVELDFNITELAREISTMDYLFEPFPTKELEGHRSAKKLPNGGFTMTREGLRSWLTDESNIGVHYTEDGERIEDNHEALIDKPTFYLVCANITPVREMPGVEHRTNRGRPTRDKSLLSHVMSSTIKSTLVLFQPHRYQVQGKWVEHSHYDLVYDDLLIREYLTCINAPLVDSIVTKELFFHIENSNLQLVKDRIRQAEEERIARLQQIARRQTEINALQEGIIDEIALEKAKLKEAGLETSSYFEGLKLKYRRLSIQSEDLDTEKTRLQQKHTLGSLEEELENLREMWPKIRMGLKKQLLSEVIQTIYITPLSPRFAAISIIWGYEEWAAKSFLIRKPRTTKGWSDEEDELLRLHFSDRSISTNQLLEMLPSHSLSSIVQRAKTKGFKSIIRTCSKCNPLIYFSHSDLEISKWLGIDIRGSEVQEIPNKIDGTLIWEKATPLA
jgi:DNA invertase Pin-like site-specific DNA recombinase